MSKWVVLVLLLAPSWAFAQNQSFPDNCPGTSSQLQQQLSRLASPKWAGSEACFWPEAVLKPHSDKLAKKEGSCSCGLKKKSA